MSAGSLQVIPSLVLQAPGGEQLHEDYRGLRGCEGLLWDTMVLRVQVREVYEDESGLRLDLKPLSLWPGHVGIEPFEVSVSWVSLRQSDVGLSDGAVGWDLVLDRLLISRIKGLIARGASHHDVLRALQSWQPATAPQGPAARTGE